MEDLSLQLKELRAGVDKDVLAIVGEGIKELTNSDIYTTSLQVGDIAPTFILENQSGEAISSAELLKEGVIIVTWYRGAWCPFCNMQLRALQKALPDFKHRGATLLAISPQKPDGSLSVKERNELEFEVLSDTTNRVAKSFGIVFKLTEKLSYHYKNTFGIDLEEYNGTTTDELPLAATYVIDRFGVIRYAYLNTDHTERSEPSEIIAILDTID